MHSPTPIILVHFLLSLRRPGARVTPTVSRLGSLKAHVAARCWIAFQPACQPACPVCPVCPVCPAHASLSFSARNASAASSAAQLVPWALFACNHRFTLRFALEAFLRQLAVVLRPAVRFQHRRNVERSRGRTPGTLRNQPLRHKLPLVDGVLDVRKDVFGWSCFPYSQEMLPAGLTTRSEFVVDPLALAMALALCCGNRGH